MRRGAGDSAMVVVAAVVVWLVITSVGGGSSGYRVEALFDNAGFAVPGEQVRIAGAPVGTISALSVTKQNLAAVTLSIAEPRLRAVLRQRDLHDPAAVADRRALRRLHPR